MLWAKAWTLRCWPEDAPCAERTTLPIPAPEGQNFTSVDEYLHGLGCPTEGTEHTDADAVSWPSDAGTAECPTYRLDRHPLTGTGPELSHAIKTDLDTLKYWLRGGPVRAGVWHKKNWDHFVTLVGYDDSEQRLKFLNSWGDQWGENGFGYIAYDDVDDEVDSADVYQFLPPPAPQPTVRVRFTSAWRQDVHLWLGVEGTSKVKKIWPSGTRQDNSKNLWFTVTPPADFTWPPTPGNRLFLDVFDQGQHSMAGGDVLEFSASFNDQHRFCDEILTGAPDPDAHGSVSGIVPAHFAPRQVLHLTID